MQTVGVILILSACLLIDRAYKERSVRGVLIQRELCALFENFKNRLPQGMRPMSVLVSGLELAELKKLGFIDALACGEVPAAAYRAVRGKLYLSAKADSVIEDFFSFATRGTGEDMERGCTAVLAMLSGELAVMEENVQVKCRLMRVVLLSLGLGLAVTVI